MQRPQLLGIAAFLEGGAEEGIQKNERNYLKKLDMYLWKIPNFGFEMRPICTHLHQFAEL
jgi:hypothetical protein